MPGPPDRRPGVVVGLSRTQRPAKHCCGHPPAAVSCGRLLGGRPREALGVLKPRHEALASLEPGFAPEAKSHGQAHVVWIEQELFGDRECASGSEDAVDLTQSLWPIGKLTQHTSQNDYVEYAVSERQRERVGLNQRRRFGTETGAEPSKEWLLNIKGNKQPGRTDGFGGRRREVAPGRTQFEDA